ncbi:MAG: hypothetical protein ALECFALPRED_001082 [Alectoria fallacina]|uniref:Uncharacterized protein n=1 Tax=Alectoria fallacina TaxID=1903189 RepID=A0A8H3I8V0_9LECA|nr:MAG: hypothetical protein ALECFALPRED_001082 [Alectoria fallacina]
MSSTKFMSLLLATIFALIFSLINGAILEKRRFVFLGNPGNLSGISPPDNASSPDVNSPSLVPEVVIAAVQENAAIPGIQALPTSSVMSPASSQITDPPPSGSAGCVPWATCNVFYPSVNLYYWPEGPQNTACLSADPPIASSLPNILNVQSPSVYAVFPSIRGHDGCSQIGTTFVNLTTSFAPGALSTVGLDSSTYSFNFDDLPCPPADVEWDFSRGPYQPQVAPPHFIFNLDPAFKTCIPGASQGIDPYTTLTTAAADSTPGPVGCVPPLCNRANRALERAHPVPWAPQKTAEPTS